MKAEGFEAKSAKNISDFDSVGELYQWLERRGWKPDWHVEPQDSVDFTIKQIQQYLVRLVQGESSLSDQVESRRKQLELANRLEETEDEVAADPQLSSIDEIEAMSTIEYEGDNELNAEMDGDDDCLN